MEIIMKINYRTPDLRMDGQPGELYLVEDLICII